MQNLPNPSQWLAILAALLVTLIAGCSSLETSSKPGGTGKGAYNLRAHAKHSHLARHHHAESETAEIVSSTEQNIPPAGSPPVFNNILEATTPAEPEAQNDSALVATDTDAAWRDIQNALQLHHREHPRIAEAMRPYVRNPKRFEAILAQARPYLHWVVQEAKRNNLPGEVMLLPFIESGYNAAAYSPRGASGLWQFTAGTGRLYGLKQNNAYDGRRDVYASTQAAIKYLQDLHRQLGGDWELALAAYNTGPRPFLNRSGKLLASKAGKSVWNLALPRETYGHMARIYAFSKLIAHPQKYGITLPAFSASHQLTAIDTDKAVSLATVAATLGISVKQLQHLNPGYRQGATLANGPQHLLVPQAQASQLLAKLPELPTENIRVANTTTRSKETRKTQKRSTSKSDVAKTKAIHRIQRGDTLWKLAQNYGVSVKELQRWNRLKSKSQLKLGQPIIVQNPA